MTDLSKIMKGKKGIVMGVANDRSIAWGIAKKLADAGAEIAFSYQGESLEKRVRPLAESIGSDFLVQCDVTNQQSIDDTFKALEDRWDKIDFVVHAIAFSDKSELDGLYLDTTRDNFLRTMDISVFSFTAVAKAAANIMNDDGSMVTLTYYGSEKVMPHYNVMGVAKAALEASVRYLANDLGPRGIRVNSISAGPIKTLAASGIGDFRYILKWNEYNSPLRRNVTIDEVGNLGLFLLSEMGGGITGELIHADAGYHSVGMVSIDTANETAELLQSINKKA